MSLHTPPRVRFRLFGAIALAAGLILSACSSGNTTTGSTEEPTASTEAPATTAAPDPTTTTTIPPTTTTTLGDPWDDITVPVFGMDEGGEFRTATFHVSFAYTVPAADDATGISWDRRVENAQFFVLGCNPPEDNTTPCEGDIIGIDPGAGTVDEAVASLTSNEVLEFTDPEPVELNGASGQRFAVRSDVQANAWEAPGGTGGIAIDDTGFADVYVLQVADRVVALYVVATFEGTFPESAQPLLDSIVWKDLR